MQHIFKRHRQLSHTVPDAVYECVRHHFTEAELVNLTLAVVAINGWNRFAIPFRTVPGTYQPHKKTTY